MCVRARARVLSAVSDVAWPLSKNTYMQSSKPAARRYKIINKVAYVAQTVDISGIFAKRITPRQTDRLKTNPTGEDIHIKGLKNKQTKNAVY